MSYKPSRFPQLTSHISLLAKFVRSKPPDYLNFSKPGFPRRHDHSVRAPPTSTPTFPPPSPRLLLDHLVSYIDRTNPQPLQKNTAPLDLPSQIWQILDPAVPNWLVAFKVPESYSINSFMETIRMDLIRSCI